MRFLTCRPLADACTTLLPNLSFAAFGTVPRISAAVATIAATLLLPVPVAAQGGVTPSFVMYGITQDAQASNGGRIYEIQANATGGIIGERPVFNTGLSFANGLAWDEGSKRLFYRAGSDNQQGTGNGLFYAYSRDTNTQTLLTPKSGSIVLGGANNSVTFASAAFFGGYYWTIATNTDELYRVSIVGDQYDVRLWMNNVDGNGGASSNGYFFGDIAINSNGSATIGNDNGRLFAFGLANDTNTNRFFQGNLSNPLGTSATSQTLGNLDINDKGGSNADLLQLGFARSGSTVGGTLFGHNRNTRQWYTVNTGTAATGGDVSAALFTSAFGYNDITSGASFQAATVPEPGTAALALLPLGVLTLAGAATRWRGTKVA